MRRRSALILAAIGAVVLGLGLVFGPRETSRSSDSAGGALAFPGLADRLATATQIDLLHKGQVLRLARKDTDPNAAWGLADRNFYPAQQGKVREFFAGLSELRLEEKRTADPAEYPRLGVEDPQGKDADSTLLGVRDAKGGSIAELIVGHAREPARGGSPTVYVRRPGEALAWLADGRLPVETDAKEWIDRNILSIPPDKLAGVKITRGGETLDFARKEGALVLQQPAEHPKLDEYKLEEIGRGLENVMLQDVRPAPPPGEPLGQAEFATTDGLVLTIAVNKSGPEVWATFAPSGKGAETLAHLKGWAYELGSWKEQALVPTLDSLKASPPPAPAIPPKP